MTLRGIVGNYRKSGYMSVKINTSNRFIDAYFLIKTCFGFEIIRFIYKNTKLLEASTRITK